MPTYLTPVDVLLKIEDLKTGELPNNFEVERDSPNNFYGMFPELLCKHGVNKRICYPCAPLPTRNPNMPEDVRQIEQEYLELYRHD